MNGTKSEEEHNDFKKAKRLSYYLTYLWHLPQHYRLKLLFQEITDMHWHVEEQYQFKTLKSSTNLKKTTTINVDPLPSVGLKSILSVVTN